MRQRPLGAVLARGNRAKIFAALTLAALTAAVVPSVATAAAGPTVNWAYSLENDLGTLRVSATADAGIAALKAYIVSYATGQDVGVVEDFTLASGTTANGIWHTTQPVQLQNLGGYRVDVEATDAAGAQVARREVGNLAYFIQSEFTPLSASPATVDYTHRKTKISGKLNGKWPANREIKPQPNETIYLGGGAGQPVAVTTGADGGFTADVEMEGPGQVEAEFAGGTNSLRVYSEPVTIAVNAAKTKMTAKVSKSRIKAGEQVTLSGQLTWRSPTGWQPLAGQQIGILFCLAEDNCPTSVDYPTTDADGRYQLTVTPFQTGFYQVGFGSEDPFIADARGKADIVVLQPAEFIDFSVARGETGAVTAKGHLKFGNFTPWPIPVEIQFRAIGSREWKTVATYENAQWDGTGYAFSSTVENMPAGTWRAFYAGRKDQIQSATSDKVVVR